MRDRFQWRYSRRRGGASELHADSASLLDWHADAPPLKRELRVLEAVRPAVVLASTQADSCVDAARAAAAGVELSRRRSGGGAVLVGPGEVLWVDVVVPRGDPLWCDDISLSGRWLGQAWQGALGDAGFAGARVHSAALIHSEWSRLACFAGLAPGEVTFDGRKVVGISQRRTRRGALFQCAMLLRWEPARLLGVMALGEATRAAGVAALESRAGGLGQQAAGPVLEALVTRLKDCPA